MSSISSQFSEGVIPEGGIHRNNSPYYSGYRWVDGDKVRFSSIVPEKLGGWSQELTSGTFLGVPRRAVNWNALNSTVYSAVGTHLFLYIRTGGTYYNITPFRKTSSLTNALTTTSGSSSVRITDVGHAARVGDYINIPSSVTYNGVTLVGDYIVITVVDNDNFTITAGTNATGSGTGGGSITVKYYLEAGLADSGAVGTGWGAGDWGEETWGTPRTTGITQEARMWCLQNWGEDLLALPLGGKLYFWDTSVGVSTPAAEVTAAPDRNNFMIVASRFRHVVVFGTEDVSAVFDPMLIRWSDIENYTGWTLTGTGGAGEFRLSKGSKIVAALETTNGEILVWTDTSLYRMRPVTTSQLYDIQLVADNCGLLSPFAVAEVDGTAYWMSKASFKVYTGQVDTLPLTLEDYIFDPREPGKYSEQQTIKFHAGVNGDFNEIWFFYATSSSVEIDRYVIYNYGNRFAYDGNMQRTAWADRGAITRATAYNASGVLYNHEVGKNDSGSPMNSFVRLGEIDISSGDRIMFSDRFMPDGEFVGSQTLTLYSKKASNSVAQSKSYTFLPTTELLPVRIKGRLLSLQLQSNTNNGDFKLGKLKMSIKPLGHR